MSTYGDQPGGPHSQDQPAGWGVPGQPAQPGHQGRPDQGQQGWGQGDPGGWGAPYGGGPGDPAGQVPAPSEDRAWAVAAHLGALVTAWFAFGFIAPLIVLLVRGRSPFARRHAVESLNFQLSMLLYSVIASIVAILFVIVTLGLGVLLLIPLAAVVLLVLLVLVIVASMRASAGETYRYPFTLRLIR
ncbi:DUF4870 domain-containing protein [Nocardioides sp. CPCC 205120]|uniref:DUF4870 domain-containing protein n=1 Tax=Nocardioides sp. CPCC 205120 TaxID=3406462 RepID=UPI003B50180E